MGHIDGKKLPLQKTQCLLG